MNYDLLYRNLVSKCPNCGGKGTIEKTETKVSFCTCLQFYTFAVRNSEIGVPISYILNYDPPVDIGDTKRFVFFKEEKKAFDVGMSLTDRGRFKLQNSVDMYALHDFDGLYGVIFHNLGLENFPNNSPVLYRILNEVITRDLYAIFSFSIPFDRIKYHYASGVVELLSTIIR